MRRKTGIALGLLAALTLVGMLKGGAIGEGATEPETITYRSKDTKAEIGTAENPFTVLEIVPSEEMAAVGYLISGCEPTDIATNTNAMVNYRTLYGDYDALSHTYGSNGIAQVDDSIHCVFKEDFPEDLGYGASDENKVLNSAADKLHFGQFGYFEHVDADQGKYNYVPADEINNIAGHFVPAAGGDYKWVPLISYEQTEGNVPPENNIGTYYLTGNVYTEQELNTADDSNAYYAFEEGTSGDVFYGISLVTDLDSARPENNQDVALSEDKIGSAEDMVGSRYYQDRYEEKYYTYVSYEILHKNQLIQTLFPTCENPEEFVSQVVTVTPEQLKGNNVTADENIIKDADMIVIHDSNVAAPVNTAVSPLAGGYATDFTSLDIDGDCFNALIHKQASGNPAMMWMDSSAMAMASTNLGRLYAVLNHMSAKYYYNVYCNSQESDAEGNPLWQAEKNPNEDGTYNLPTQTGTFLGASSFVLNWDGTGDFLSKVIPVELKLSDDANTTILSAVSKMYAASRGMTYDAESQVVTPLKSQLNILELEPIAKFIYGEDGWRSYYLDMIPDDFVGTSANLADDVHVTAMATYEFNGKIEDLNSTYDMILIGAEQDETNGLNGYNDTALGHLAYTTVGDLVSTDDGTVYFDDYDRFVNGCDFQFNVLTNQQEQCKKNNFHWLSGRVDLWNNRPSQSASFIGSNKGSDIAQCNTRYSGTDVTEKKYEELMDFALKNPIIVDGKLYKDSGEVDDAFVDESSFVYYLAKVGTISYHEGQPLIKRYADVRRDADAVYANRVLETSCELVFSAETGIPNANQGENGKPVAYTYQEKDADKKTIDKGTISNNNQKDEDNNNVLRYHFTLYGDADASYKVKLWIDSNGNGSFEEDEWKEDLRIVDTTVEDIEPPVVDQSKGETLQAGHTYTVTRILPHTEVGMLPWKIQVYNTETSSIRDSEIGYTRIAGVDKTTVNVLQMNLTSQDDMNKNEETGINFADDTSSVGNRFQEYLDGVDDYDINVTFLENEDFYNLYGKDNKVEAWTEYLMGYDMLILGFGDMASFSDNEVFLEGFKEFVDAGKSVILSHDMVYDKSFAYPDAGFEFNWGWEFSENRDSCWAVDEETSAYLRELSGQVQRYFAIDTTTMQPIGSYSSTYSRGNKISMMPKSDLEVAYMYRWHSNFIGGYWEFKPDASMYCWMDQSDYRYRLPGVREYVCNLMDNSIRTMAFASRVKSSDKIDRVITNPSNNNTNVPKSDLAWTDSCITTTVKVANKGQITTYPFTMDDTITVGQTHAQNYRLDLESGETSGFDSRFDVNGEFPEWEDVPKTDGSWWTDAPDKNKGTILYERGLAYGYAEANEAGAANRNGGAFSGLQVTVEQEDGVSQNYQVKYLTVADDGSINLNPQIEGLLPGDYTFYLGSDGFSSTNINNLNTNPYWNDDMIWGKMIMHITDGPDVAEFSLDVDAIARWNRQNPLDITKVNNVVACLYGLSSTNGTPPSYASKDTDSFVLSLGTKKTDGAIVWYNLSNGVGDSTDIYSAKDGDSANNYYIYTRGNVTYTGLGHSGDMTDDEIRLFINTMISSYRSIPAAPYPTCVNEDVIRNGKVYTLYGEENGGEVMKDITVSLKVNDDSVQSNYQNYTMTVKDGEGNIVHEASGLANGEITSYVVKKDDLQEKQSLTYTATLEATGKNDKKSKQQITIRVMTMPLFGLD